MLRNRLVVAIVLIVLVVYALDVGGLFFFSLVALLVLVAAYEFFDLMQRAGFKPITPIGLGLVAIFLSQAYARVDWTRDALIITILLTLILAVFRSGDGWLMGWGLTLAGALYVGGLGAYFLLMRDLPDGKVWSAIVALTTWAMDTAAYSFGKRWGRHPFFPSVSPKKTREGAIGGWVCAVLGMLLIGGLYDLPLIHNLALGIGIALVGTFGDLAESVIKRQVGAKDSSAILGAHGGILDRIDSLLFVAPFVYYYATWVLRIS